MRQHSRLTFRHLSSIQVTNRLSGAAIGYVADMSQGGLRLIGTEPLVTGGCYEMVLHVPGGGAPAQEVDVVVICQWSRKDSRREHFEMGFALDRPSPQFATLIAQLLPKRR